MKDEANSIYQAAQNREDIAEIKRRYDNGEIDRETARRLVLPILVRINARSAEIAKKHGYANYPKQTFINVMRSSY